MSQWTDKHYNYTYKLTNKDISAGEIRVDAYFVAKVWKTGSKDDSGALWHCLKTIARFGDKNDVEREIKALYAQVKGLARSFDVELEESTEIECDTCEGVRHYDNRDLGIPRELYNSECPCPDCDGEGYLEVTTSGEVSEKARGSGVKQSPWYPDDSGEWIEYDGSGQPVDNDVVVEVLFHAERGRQCWKEASTRASGWCWDIKAGSAKIVAYKIVK